MLSGDLDSSRYVHLADEFEKEYMKSLDESLCQIQNDWEIVFPESEKIFHAFNTTSFDKVKVIVLWQDPYHWAWQAHGLSFSVQESVRIPPSLRNIYKELANDLWTNIYTRSGDLTHWAEQWVLLLNAILTVTASKPASHRTLWWERFTDKIITTISSQKEWCVFLLRWKFAQSKHVLIDEKKHLILQASHPSPFSAYRWFFWCNHFSSTNEYLMSHGKQPISW